LRNHHTAISFEMAVWWRLQCGDSNLTKCHTKWLSQQCCTSIHGTGSYTTRYITYYWYYTVSQKKSVQIFFVRISSNFHQFW